MIPKLAWLMTVTTDHELINELVSRGYPREAVDELSPKLKILFAWVKRAVDFEKNYKYSMDKLRKMSTKSERPVAEVGSHNEEKNIEVTELLKRDGIFENLANAMRRFIDLNMHAQISGVTKESLETNRIPLHRLLITENGITRDLTFECAAFSVLYVSFRSKMETLMDQLTRQKIDTATVAFGCRILGSKLCSDITCDLSEAPIKDFQLFGELAAVEPLGDRNRLRKLFQTQCTAIMQQVFRNGQIPPEMLPKLAGLMTVTLDDELINGLIFEGFRGNAGRKLHEKLKNLFDKMQCGEAFKQNCNYSMDKFRNDKH